MSRLGESERDVATTPVVKAQSTLIHWKSAHASHIHDKAKELCGRGFCLRHALDRKNSEPIPASGINRLILVLDGDFSASQVINLKAAGWDEVLSVGDIEQLPSLII